MAGIRSKVRFVIPVKRKRMPEMEDFYSRGLGFSVTEDGEILFGGEEGGIGRFMYRDGKEAVGMDAILEIEIEKDFGVYCRHLKEGGARFEMIARMPAGYVAHLRDPSGNLITLLCYEDDETNDEIVYGWNETVTID
ncbi:VOC family protein [Burkholderia stagnalis]|nr:VOC family protein [Burkholderia stagnalis]